MSLYNIVARKVVARILNRALNCLRHEKEGSSVLPVSQHGWNLDAASSTLPRRWYLRELLRLSERH